MTLSFEKFARKTLAPSSRIRIGKGIERSIN